MWEGERGEKAAAAVTAGRMRGGRGRRWREREREQEGRKRMGLLRMSRIAERVSEDFTLPEPAGPSLLLGWVGNAPLRCFL